MAWVGSFVCLSYKRQIFEAMHNFLTDEFRLALYTSDANLSPSLQWYETMGEVLPLNGYMTGGKPILLYPPTLVGSVALVEFGPVTWPASSFTARGAVCYNASRGGATLFVLDFQTDRIANDGDFTVRFPGPDPNAAILRIT